MSSSQPIPINAWQEKANAKAQQRLEKHVTPWVEKFPFQATHPVRYDGSEGYAGQGIIGCRAGPADAIEFDNLCHEMAHAIEISESKGLARLRQREWGMRITSFVTVAGERYYEPRTVEPSRREARTVAIQIRLMELVDHPAVKTRVDYYSDLFVRLMPDWYLGAENEKDRREERKQWIRTALEQWPTERVVAAWQRIQPTLEALAHPKPRRRLGR